MHIPHTIIYIDYSDSILINATELKKLRLHVCIFKPNISLLMKPLDLLLTPFCIMDITPMYYRSETPEIAKKTIESLLNKVQAVDGTFVSLWHNESLGETDRWKGWRSVYVHLNKLANDIIFSE